VKTHIEFLGLPGAGKTTLCRELCRYARSLGCKAFEAEEALYVALRRRSRWYSLRRPVKYCSYARGRRWLHEVYSQPCFCCDALAEFLDAHGGMARTLAAILRRPEQFQDSALLVKWLVQLFSSYELAADMLKRDETMLLDEGFCNRALSIFGYCSGAADPDQVRSYIAAVPAPDAVICIDASAQTRRSRLIERGLPARLKNTDPARRAELERNFEACLAAAAAALAGRGIPVLHVSNDGSLEDCYRDLHARARRIFHETGICAA